MQITGTTRARVGVRVRRRVNVWVWVRSVVRVRVVRIWVKVVRLGGTVTSLKALGLLKG